MAATNPDDKPKNIFLSWQGPRSKAAALAMYDWLPLVLQSASPWISKHDIGLGKISLPEIQIALASIEVGVFFVTVDNATAPWMLYEAGAISKKVMVDALVCPYLLDGQDPGSVPKPIGMYQSTPSDEDGTLVLVKTIHNAIKGGLTEGQVEKVFKMWWPELKKKLDGLPPAGATAPKPSDGEMLESLVETTRAIQGQLASVSAQINADRVSRTVERAVEEILAGRSSNWMRHGGFASENLANAGLSWLQVLKDRTSAADRIEDIPLTPPPPTPPGSEEKS